MRERYLQFNSYPTDTQLAVEFAKPDLVSSVRLESVEGKWEIRVTAVPLVRVTIWMAFVYAVIVVVLLKYGSDEHKMIGIGFGFLATAGMVGLFYLLDRTAKAQGSLAIIDPKLQTVELLGVPESIAVDSISEIVEVIGGPAGDSESSWFCQALVIVAMPAGVYRAYVLCHEINRAFRAKSPAQQAAEILHVKFRSVSIGRFK